MTASLAHRVETVVREVADAAILPRFRALSEADVTEKTGPADLVTVADREAEALLTRRLPDLVPGSVVVGEEGVAADPSALDRLGADAVWIVDPVDGTGNFVAGSDRFGVMVALVRNGETVLGVIYPPADGRCALAERGAGARFGGARLAGRRGVPFARAVGDYSSVYLDEPLRSHYADRFARAGGTTQGRCSAWAYLDAARGASDFVMQYRMTVWDHAPGVLMVEEAGGRAAFLDGGARYAPIARPDAPMLATADAQAWDAYAAALA